MSATRKSPGSALWAYALFVTALAASVASAAPQVRVGDAGGGRIEIEAQDASLDQVLDALRARHLIQSGVSDPLTGTVTGTYSGTLPQVLSRILGRYNYFLQVTPSGTQLHIINAAPSNGVAGSAMATMAPAPTTAPNTRRPVSSNVDADDERAEEGATRPLDAKVPAWAPRSPTTPYPIVPTPTGTTPAAPRVSSNLDAD